MSAECKGQLDGLKNRQETVQADLKTARAAYTSTGNQKIVKANIAAIEKQQDQIDADMTSFERRCK